ncbi:MAG: hypothetical protein ACXAEU_21875 [Candidatus Hodarchaeales archaeon]|jgi:hypothetical protein
MKLKKYYEDDAWELIEDYFDKIHESLLKANIKGEERQRVTSDLQSHVQMKADEIFDKKGVVTYTDVLEIMGEVGSPAEIAQSYVQDDEAIAISEEELLSTKGGVEIKEVEKPISGMINQLDEEHEELIPSTVEFNKKWEKRLLAWRFIQVLVFTYPWLSLTSNWGWYWYQASNFLVGYYDNRLNTLSVYLLFVFLSALLEYYYFPKNVFSRLNRQFSHQRLSVVIFRYGFLSTLALFVSFPPSIAYIGLITVGAAIFLNHERMINTDFFKHVKRKMENNWLIKSKNGNLIVNWSLTNLLIATVGVYAGLMMLLLVALISAVMRSPENLILFYCFTFLGMILAMSILLLNIRINQKLNQPMVFPQEVDIIVWSFRWFLAVFIVIATTTISTWNVVIWGVLILLPLLAMEQVFTSMVKKETSLECNLGKTLEVAYNELKIIGNPIWPTRNMFNRDKAIASPVIQDLTPEKLTTSKPIYVKASKAKTVQYIPSATPSKMDTTSEQPVITSDPLQKSSPLVSFIEEIISVYVKLIILAFKLAFLSLVIVFVGLISWVSWNQGNIQDWYFYSLLSQYLAYTIIYTSLTLIISSYKLYSKSNTIKHRFWPIYYWLLTLASWFMIGITYYVANPIPYVSGGVLTVLILILASPFIIVQLVSSKRILFRNGNINSEDNSVINKPETPQVIYVKNPVSNES